MRQRIRYVTQLNTQMVSAILQINIVCEEMVDMQTHKTHKFNMNILQKSNQLIHKFEALSVDK
jgi:hypothetical protein